MKSDYVVCDVETYRNYFLVALKNTRNGKVKTFEKYDGQDLDREGLINLLRKYRIVTFNGNHYDMPMIALALAGRSCSELKDASDMIIRTDLRPWIFERQYGVSIPRLDHVDLMEVAPLKASLKIYNGRLHGRRMQDLPYDPDALLDADQREATKAYCVNDLDATALLLRACEEPIELREVMSEEYGLDLRSKSDAQVAEAVVKAELEKLSGEKLARPSLPPGFSFRYQIPAWMRFETPVLRDLLDRIREHDFTLDHNQRVVAPSFLKDTPYQVGSAKYALGIGGMHSMEQSTAHVSDDEFVLIDRDVASYYPMIILNQRLFPKHIGEAFLDIYRRLVKDRLAIKEKTKAINKRIAELENMLKEGNYDDA